MWWLTDKHHQSRFEKWNIKSFDALIAGRSKLMQLRSDCQTRQCWWKMKKRFCDCIAFPNPNVWQKIFCSAGRLCLGVLLLWWVVGLSNCIYRPFGAPVDTVPKKSKTNQEFRSSMQLEIMGFSTHWCWLGLTQCGRDLHSHYKCIFSWLELVWSSGQKIAVNTPPCSNIK